MTSRPCAAIDTARLADTVVLPTPPLPPVTVMTFTGREALISANSVMRSGDSLKLLMGMYSAEVARQIGFIAGPGSAALHVQCRTYQPDTPRFRRMDVLGHTLAVA